MMTDVYLVLGFLTFWASVVVILLYLGVYIKDFWDKYKSRFWVYQVYDIVRAWYVWDYKKKPIDKTMNWRTVELLREHYQNPKTRHILKKFALRFIVRLLSTKEYQEYKFKKENEEYDTY